MRWPCSWPPCPSPGSRIAGAVRRPLLWGLLGLAFTTLAFAYCRTYWVLLIARALQGVAGAATWVPGMALVADHFPREERGRAMGIVFAGANLGLLLGPPLAGFLDHYLGPQAPFHLGIALVVVDALGRGFLLRETPPLLEPPIPWSVLLRNRVVLVFAGATALGAAFWTLMESALPLNFSRRLGLGPRGISGSSSGAAALAHALSRSLDGAGLRSHRPGSRCCARGWCWPWSSSRCLFS